LGLASVTTGTRAHRCPEPASADVRVGNVGTGLGKHGQGESSLSGAGVGHARADNVETNLGVYYQRTWSGLVNQKMEVLCVFPFGHNAPKVKYNNTAGVDREAPSIVSAHQSTSRQQDQQGCWYQKKKGDAVDKSTDRTDGVWSQGEGTQTTKQPTTKPSPKLYYTTRKTSVMFETLALSLHGGA